MYLLDTNVLSEFRRPRPDLGVIEWMRAQRPGDLYLSVITVMEHEIGFRRIERRDEAQARRLQQWLEDSVLAGFESRILPIDLAVARCCAASHVPDPAPERDALIAATALVHGLTVVTRNERDFRRFGVSVMNPFSA